MSNLRRGPASLTLLIGSTVVVAFSACRKESELRSREHTGGENAAGAAVAGTTSGAATAACGGSHPATCFLDTARADPRAIPGEDYPEAKWIFFAASGDSVEVSVDSSAVTTNFGQERDAHQNTASSFHKRLAQSGVFEVALTIAPFLQGHSPPYVIRFHRFEASANSAFRATGERSVLTIESKSDTEMFAVIPLTMMRAGTDASRWQVYAGEYRVALVADSLYVVCRKQCSSADTLKLIPGLHAKVHY